MGILLPSSSASGAQARPRALPPPPRLQLLNQHQDLETCQNYRPLPPRGAAPRGAQSQTPIPPCRAWTRISHVGYTPSKGRSSSDAPTRRHRPRTDTKANNTSPTATCSCGSLGTTARCRALTAASTAAHSLSKSPTWALPEARTLAPLMASSCVRGCGCPARRSSLAHTGSSTSLTQRRSRPTIPCVRHGARCSSGSWPSRRSSVAGLRDRACPSASPPLSCTPPLARQAPCTATAPL